MTEKRVPWWKIHEITDEVKGKVEHFTCIDSRGNVKKKIVIEYTEND